MHSGTTAMKVRELMGKVGACPTHPRSERDRVTNAQPNRTSSCPSGYGFRPGRGCKDALREVDGLLKEGYEWIVDADLKNYFDTIDHDELMALVRAKVADGLVST